MRQIDMDLIGVPVFVIDVEPDGTFRNLTPALDPGFGHVVRIVGVSVDITERKAVGGILSDAAFSDPLTGLANRRAFERDAHAAIGRARSSGRAFGLAVVDLDGFKSINDIHGHRRGDGVLCHVASLMKLTARAEESVARLGGDEFALTLDAPSQTEPGKRASQISRFLNRNLTVAESKMRIGASIGCALWKGERFFDQLFEAADADMYRNRAARKANAASRDEGTAAILKRLSERA